MTATTLHIKLGDRDFEIAPLNLRQHREIELANLKPIPPANKEDGREAREDSYERLLSVVCSALSAKYPEVTRQQIEDIPGLDLVQLGRAYAAIQDFGGYVKAEAASSGEAQPHAEAAPA